MASNKEEEKLETEEEMVLSYNSTNKTNKTRTLNIKTPLNYFRAKQFSNT